VLESFPQSQVMEISYDNITCHHPRRPSLAEETLLVEISWRNIKHFSLCGTNNYVLIRMREFQKDPSKTLEYINHEYFRDYYVLLPLRHSMALKIFEHFLT
jgi:hypothetical protein